MVAVEEELGLGRGEQQANFEKYLKMMRFLTIVEVEIFIMLTRIAMLAWLFSRITGALPCF